MKQKNTADSKELEKENQIKDAVTGLKSGKYKNLREAENATGIPKSTIHSRMNGWVARRKSQERNQVLSHSEEKELARYITYATIAGKPAPLEVVRKIAEIIRTRRLRGVNEPRMDLVTYNPIGINWATWFRGRYPHLACERLAKIESARNEVNLEEILCGLKN